MRKNRLILLLFAVFLLTACQRKSEVSIKPDTNSYDVNQDELTDDEKDIVENGYVVDGYRILLMNKQKESLKDIKMYLAYNYFEDDFLK